jgi:type IV pilus assembly protein PilV
VLDAQLSIEWVVQTLDPSYVSGGLPQPEQINSMCVQIVASDKSQPVMVSKQTGVSLIEVLVTVIILSIGFLGMASMQLMGAKNVSQSHYRTLATMYAYDMAERMRSNPGGVEQNHYDDADTQNNNYSDPSCGDIATPCTVQQIAQRDLAAWQETLTAGLNAGGLPSGFGTITENAGEYTLAVSWDEVSRDANGFSDNTDPPQTFSITVAL